MDRQDCIRLQDRRNPYELAVARFTINITAAVARLRQEGTAGMSRDNLWQVVSMAGVSCPNAYTARQAFEDACNQVAPRLRGFALYTHASEVK